MFYLSSSLPSSMTNPPSLPRFVSNGPYHWSLAPRGHVSILGVLRCYSLRVPMVGCSYFPEVFWTMLFEVCCPNIGLVPFVYILKFLSSHTY